MKKEDKSMIITLIVSLVIMVLFGWAMCGIKKQVNGETDAQIKQRERNDSLAKESIRYNRERAKWFHDQVKDIPEEDAVSSY